MLRRITAAVLLAAALAGCTAIEAEDDAFDPPPPTDAPAAPDTDAIEAAASRYVRAFIGANWETEYMTLSPHLQARAVAESDDPPLWFSVCRAVHEAGVETLPPLRQIRSEVLDSTDDSAMVRATLTFDQPTSVASASFLLGIGRYSDGWLIESIAVEGGTTGVVDPCTGAAT